MPRQLISDNATTFDNLSLKQINLAFGIDHLKAAPYHSRGNALAERAIQSLQEKVWIFTNGRQSDVDWDLKLSVATLVINSSTHKTTGFAPFELTFGRKPIIATTVTRQQEQTPYELHAKIISDCLGENFSTAAANQVAAQKASEKQFAKRSRAKFANRFDGPYEVIEWINNSDIYKIKNLQNSKTTIWHKQQLKPFCQNSSSSMKTVAFIAILSLVCVLAAGDFEFKVSNQKFFAQLNLQCIKQLMRYFGNMSKSTRVKTYNCTKTSYIGRNSKSRRN